MAHLSATQFDDDDDEIQNFWKAVCTTFAFWIKCGNLIKIKFNNFHTNSWHIHSGANIMSFYQ